MTRNRLFLFAMTVAGFSGQLFAEDWTEFRGPTGQGISTAKNLPVRWSSTENVRGKVKIPGKGWSSPVVFRDRIFLTTAVSKPRGNSLDRSLRTLCLAAETGLPLSYFSIGQNVPDDAVLAHPGMVANLVMEGGDRRGRTSAKSS